MNKKDMLEQTELGNVTVKLTNNDIKRYRKAYDCLAMSLNPEDYTEKDLKNFKELFYKIVKCK